jgi:hypothetical protein
VKTANRMRSMEVRSLKTPMGRVLLLTDERQLELPPDDN